MYSQIQLQDSIKVDNLLHIIHTTDIGCRFQDFLES